MNKNISAMYTLLTDPDFARLWERQKKRTLSLNELISTSLPEGMTLSDVYNTVFLLQRQSGFRVRRIRKDAPEYFFSLSGRHIQMLNLLSSKSSNDTALMHNMKRYLKSDSFHRVLFDDVRRLFAMEGLSISNERMDQLFFAPPDKSVLSDQLFLNLKDLLVDAHSMVDQSFSDRLLRFMYERLIQDIDPRTFKEHYGFHMLRPEQFMARIKPELLRDELYRVLNEDSLLEDALPVASILILSEQLSFISPFPYFNGMLILVLYALFLFKTKFPGVAYAPVLYFQPRWKAGKMDRNAVSLSCADAAPTFSDCELSLSEFAGAEETTLAMMQANTSVLFPGEYDISKWLLVALEITYCSTIHLEELMSKEVLIPTEFILSDASLNKRQHAALVTASNNPDLRFTIEDHQKNYRTAYATARADLLELAEKGYLKKVKEGKHFVFQISQSPFHVRSEE